MPDDARMDMLEERPLRLRAEAEDDIVVLGALLQDAVGRVGDAAFLARKRRFVALVNRFRWESELAGREPERVRAAVNIENVSCVKARGVDASDKDAVYCVLSVTFEPGEDGAGLVRLILSGGAEIRAEVEALSIRVEDVSQPWTCKAAPHHLAD